VSALLFLAFGRIILSLASVSNGPKSNITLKMKGLLSLGTSGIITPKTQNNTAEDLNLQTQYYCHFPTLKILAKFENRPELIE
jgi:hypothetical protein